MKPLQTLLAVSLLTCATAHAGFYYSGTLDSVIPDANPNGISSTINVSGLGLGHHEVSVSVNLSGGANGDLYAYLSYGNNSVVLLNRVGKTSTDAFGSSTAGMLATFSDYGATDIHTYAEDGPITGIYQPDRRTADPQVVLDTSFRGSSLASFDAPNMNGNWTLFFADMASGGGNSPSTLMSWSLEVTPVPEMVNLSLMIFGGLFLVGTLARNQRVREQIRRRYNALVG